MKATNVEYFDAFIKVKVIFISIKEYKKPRSVEIQLFDAFIKRRNKTSNISKFYKRNKSFISIKGNESD